MCFFCFAELIILLKAIAPYNVWKAYFNSFLIGKTTPIRIGHKKRNQ